MVLGARALRATLLRLATPLAASRCRCGALVAATLAHRRCTFLPCGPAELAGPVAYILALHLFQGLSDKQRQSK